MKKDYLDNVLIKLKRKYSKNEVISALTKKLSDAEVENGKLKSEIFELEHKIKTIRKDLQKELKQEIHQKVYSKINSKFKEKDDLISRLRTANSDLISRLNNIKSPTK